MRVSAVEIEGLERTDRSLMKQYFADIFQASSKDEMEDKLCEALEKCQNLQIFKDVDVSYQSTGLTDTRVYLKVQERKGKLFVGSEWLSTNELVGVSFIIKKFLRMIRINLIFFCCCRKLLPV